MDDYICKPVRINSLHATLAHWSQLASTGSPDVAPPVDAAPSRLDPGIMAGLRELESSKAGVLTELFRVFTENNDARLAVLRQAIIAQDAEAIRTTAHSLRGSSGTFGALALSALFDRMEQLAIRGDLADADACLAQISAEYAAVCEELQPRNGQHIAVTT
jgi:HPt (histidine-containing phosphotransfer) domain-containing protein